MSRLRLTAEWLCILALALGVAGWAALHGTTARLDLQLLDRIAARAAAPASDQIVIVAIDDRSLAELGQWPWDRRIEAQLIDRLAAAKARLVELDVLLTEPSNEHADAALAGSMARAGNVALPHAFSDADGRSTGLDAVRPLAELARSAVAVGHVSLRPDSDGVIRRIALKSSDGRTSYPQLQLAVYRALHRADPPELGRSARVNVASVVPLRTAGSYRTVPAASVVRGEVPAGFFTDKIVLIGATAAGLGDVHSVPASAGSLMTGIELQANLLQTLQEDSFIRPADPAAVLWLSLLPVFALFIGFWRLRPAWGLALVLTLGGAQVLGSIVLAAIWREWLPPGPALLGMAVAYPLWGWRRLSAVSGFLKERAERLEPSGTLGPASGFDSIARKVSRLNFLVDEVSERRSFLQRVLESTPDAMCVFGADGALLLMNARARALFGDAAFGEGAFGEGAGGLSLNDMLLDIRAQPAERDDEVLLADGRSFAITRSVGAEDGEWGALSIAVLADVTEARQADTQRRQMLEFLSHDMRAPQVAILSLTALDGASATPADRLHRIRGHARRTLELADTFVQLARLNDAPLARDEIDVTMLIDEAVDRAHGAAKAGTIKLTTRITAEQLPMIGDGQVLSRVLDNLIGNAIRYCPAGSEVVLSAAVAARARPGQTDLIVLEISDNGPGLPKPRMADPFQRFGSRSNGAESVAFGGAGLGLAFVAAAVKRHRGEVTCQTAPDQGTRFTIRLPADQVTPE